MTRSQEVKLLNKNGWKYVEQQVMGWSSNGHDRRTECFIGRWKHETIDCFLTRREAVLMTKKWLREDKRTTAYFKRVFNSI